jgi:hypothetical protein
VVVDVALPPVFLLRIPVRDVHVLHRRMVVIVGMGRQEMAPVLASMHVMRDVEVLVPVLQRLVLMVALLLRHRAHTLPDDSVRS